MEGSLEGSHGDRVREGDGVGDRGGLHHYQGLNSRAVAPELGVGEEPLRSWCNRYGPAERSSRPQESLEEENRRLRSEVTDMRRANEILKKASAFYPRSPIAPRRNDPVHRYAP